jgi:hypothetical protein
MFQAAVSWLVENRAGTAEIWVASDLQRSNWRPEDPRWKTVLDQIESLPQSVRIRLLAVAASEEPNASILLKEVNRRPRNGQAELHVLADLQRNVSSSEALPLNFILDGTPSQTELPIESLAFRWRYKAELGEKKSGGWGAFELPADANRHDNKAYFVYGPEAKLQASVVTSHPQIGRYLQMASSAMAGSSAVPAEMVMRSQAEASNWSDKTLLAWQDVLPSDTIAESLRKFVEEGGSVVFFPPGRTDSQRFLGVGWGDRRPASGPVPGHGAVFGRWKS